MATKARRTTDDGTVVLHVLLVVAFVFLTATGLRLATDDPESEWLLVLDPVLPMENLWFRHLFSGVALAAALAAYAIYLRKARLGARVRLDRARIAAMFRPGAARWAAINVLVLWVFLASLAIETLTGIMLFFGANRATLNIHMDVTYLCIGCVIGHVALHAASGGLPQLLRVARPAPLVIAPPPPDLAEILAEHLAKQAETGGEAGTGAGEAKKPASCATLSAHPLATALAGGLVVVGALLGAEQATRQSLYVREIPSELAPVLDGDLADPIWATVEPVRVLTTQGGDFGGSHQSMVEVRAVHDMTYAYFAFVWEDPTRSLKHMPLVKREGRWQIAATREDLGDERTYNEDKFAVLLTQPGLPLIGAAIHLARHPLSSRPGSATGRGLHYTSGGIADLWQWRASHEGFDGHIDNGHFGPAKRPVDVPLLDPEAHYSGGFALDSRHQPYMANADEPPAAVAAEGVVPKRLPRDPTRMAQTMGQIINGAKGSESETARWWMVKMESVPWTAAGDAAIPDGTIIPGVVMDDRMVLSPASIRGRARWAAGRWTLEVARRLYTGSKLDVPIKSGVLMWVAAFDHAAKRHTRHLRPLRLEVD